MSRLNTLSNTQRLHGKLNRGASKSYYDHTFSSTKYLRKVIYQTLTKGRNPHHIK